MDKLLTIAIPSYNSEKTLNKCVDSLLDERIIEALDIIIVNDGSKDRTSEIAHKYAEEYPQSIRAVDKENGGHGSGVNMGMKLAYGKYFRVLDSDDWFDTEALVSFVGQLNDLDCDVVHTDGNFVSAIDGMETPNVLKGYEYGRVYSIDEVCAMNFQMTMLGITLKTELIKSNKLELQEKTFYVDNEYCTLPLAYVKSFCFLDINIYRYLIGQATQSMAITSRVKHFNDILKVVYRLSEAYMAASTSNASDDGGLSLMRENVRAVAMSIFPIALIYNQNKGEGRKQYREYVGRLKSICPAIYADVATKGRVYLLMNIFRISTDTYIKIQEKRGNHVVC